jgi:phosphatidylethanolamine/phosphatidyl-N-methylethanolamine N-methyltransferase
MAGNPQRDSCHFYCGREDWAMRQTMSQYRTFFREARDSFGTVGAVMPSGRFLARAIASELRACDGPVRVLEVGPGTGALTWEIVRYIRATDQFDAVELNAGFVTALRERFRNDWHFRRVADRTRILHMPIQELDDFHSYDFVISGLPLNSFQTEVVQTIFRSFMRLIKPGGVLSFFEYLWIRDVHRFFLPRPERRRLVRVGSLIERYVNRYEFRRDTVVVNVPPALVHHLRLQG